MDLCIVAPVASADIAPLLHDAAQPLPAGYTGAPLTAVLIGELLRAGHRVHAITVDYHLPPGSRAARAEGERFVFEVLPGRRRAWRFEAGRPGRALDAFADERRALLKAITAASPELVHAHWSYEFALAAIDSGLPHVVTAHDSPRQVWRYTRSPYRALRWWMARDALRRARCVTAVSDYMAAEVQPMARVAVQVVPNPVAPQALTLGRERGAPAARRIGMVCNGWTRFKNPEPALRAFARLRGSLPGAELHLFGADFGSGEQAQRWLAAQGSVGGIAFHGRLPHHELLVRLAGLDLLLHPALEESFGVVVAEAMALGLPVVAGAHSGAVPWVAGEAQWLVDVTDEVAIEAAVVQALSDHARYATASRAGRQRVLARFSAAPVAERYLNLYDTVLAGARARPAAVAATAA